MNNSQYTESQYQVITSGKASNDVDFTGWQFGYLKVKESQGKSKQGQRIWKCICRCNGITLRATGSLIHAARSGRFPMCKECRNKELAEYHAMAYYDKKKNTLFLWHKYRTIYSIKAQDKINLDIIEALRDEFGDERNFTMKELLGIDMIEYDCTESYDVTPWNDRGKY